MDTDKLIQKWLSDELTDQERNAFDTLEDATLYKDIIADAAHFKADAFSGMPDFETFKQRIPTSDVQNTVNADDKSRPGGLALGSIFAGCGDLLKDERSSQNSYVGPIGPRRTSSRQKTGI